MNTLSPLFVFLIFSIALVTAYFLNLKFKEKNASSRYKTIDGLRGFLAMGVFIHHSSIWYQYIHVGEWKVTDSNLINHLGQTTVAFFFMITSFLFITKLLNSIEKDFDWKYFFISRLYRLVPMYYVSLVIILFYIMIISNWHLKVDGLGFGKSIFDWLVFTITKSPNINNFDMTHLINAGVLWSLPFEWLFYFSLPLIAIFILKQKPSFFYIVLSVAFIALFFFLNGISQHNLFSFVGGAIAPFIIKFFPNRIDVNKTLFSFIILLCILLIGQFDTTNNLICKLLIFTIFNLIALGNTFFGLLNSSTLKFLGDISYSTYLLHGILLFTVIYFIIGIDTLKNYTSIEYCLVIFLLTPLVVVISFLGFEFIEKPFMNRAKKINSK